MSYNGYTNYETWAVSLWLDNDYGAYQHWSNVAEDWGGEPWDLAEAVKDFVFELNPLAGDSSMFTDLLNGALSEVNWLEIAEGYLEAAKENAKV